MTKKGIFSAFRRRKFLFEKTWVRRPKGGAYFDIALRHFMQIFIRFGVPATVVLMVRRLGTKSRLLTL
jgi:hypothetical protein